MPKKRFFFEFLLICILFSSIGSIVVLNSLNNRDNFTLITRLELSNYNIYSNWWSLSGNPICLAESNQTNAQIVRSGLGNFIVWQDNRSGNWDIYAQRIDDDGFIQRIDYFGFVWTLNGVIVCNSINDQINPQLIPDNNKGIIIVWQDNRSGNWDIYAQRINEAGTLLWNQSGIIVCNENQDQTNPKIVVDLKGGAIISWVDNRTGFSTDIFAQYINSSGEIQWSGNGTVICNGLGDQNNQVMCPSVNNGAIIVWVNSSSGNNDIYAQLINSSGITIWENNGSVVCNASNDQQAVQVVIDGEGGCIVVWEDLRNGNSDIFTQKINQTGNILWEENGTAICNDSNSQINPKLCEDNVQGAIISWLDNRTPGNHYDIYGQHINSTGVVIWTLNGSIICEDTSNQENQQIIKRTNGAIIVWADNRSNSYGIYCQFLGSSGNGLLEQAGRLIYDADNAQNCPQLCSDSFDGAIIIWEDERNGIDIYAQRIFRDGRVAPLNIFIPYSVDLSPNIPLIIFILLAFGIPLCTAFTYCLLQMRPKKIETKEEEADSL